ncbi:hypothetical protein B7486_06260 [cyanobacterium TDX16]|nr:hypothetical protein B7486_06260 [cyanobacterium TDX16]
MGMGVTLAVTILIAINSGRSRERLDWPTFVLYVAPFVVVGNAAVYVASAAIEWYGYEGLLHRSTDRDSEHRVQFKSADGVYELSSSAGTDEQPIQKVFEAPIGQSIVFGIIVSVVATTFGLFTRSLTVFVTDRRLRPGLCLNCGYDLTGNRSGICPECGAAVVNDQEWAPS